MICRLATATTSQRTKIVMSVNGSHLRVIAYRLKENVALFRVLSVLQAWQILSVDMMEVSKVANLPKN